MKSANAYLQKEINHILENEVAQTVKEVEQENIVQTIYSYPSHFYERRGIGGGGLGSIPNMRSELIGELATFNSLYILLLNALLKEQGKVPICTLLSYLDKLKVDTSGYAIFQ